MKKIRIIFGLFGVSSDGVLYMPSGKKIIKLSNKKTAFKIQKFLNERISYVGLNNQIFLFSRLRMWMVNR